MIVTKDNFKNFGLKDFEYRPSLLFKNHHLNTTFPYAMRKSSPPMFNRKRYETMDGDFYDLDFVFKGSENICILLHGLEGGSQSQYILGLTDYLRFFDTDVCAVNHRSCSGEMNRITSFYHSGYTTDLIKIVEDLSTKYKNVFLAGYSLGGNMLLKYLGSHSGIPSNVRAAIAFSVPCHLSSSAVMLNHWSNKIYSIKFLATLNKKIVEKARMFPDEMNEDDYKGIKSLYEYDNKVTAPLHGFVDAEDYYAQSSSKQFLENIKVPTLLINAKDDSFLAPPCFPNEIADGHEHFHFLTTRYGGHVGYSQFNLGAYWSDMKVVEFFGLEKVINWDS